jgi:hypothetical protein
MFSRPSKISLVAPTLLPRFDTSGIVSSVTAGKKIGIYDVLGYVLISGINKREKIEITATTNSPGIKYQITSSSTSPFTKWNADYFDILSDPVQVVINNGQYLHLAMEAAPGGDDGDLNLMSPDINGKILFTVSYTF